MAQHIWFLVEWIDERNVFSTYGIVNVDTPAFNETEMNPGKEILIQVKHGIPRRAQILRVSENKSYLEEHKNLLERQDQKVKNVLQMCMRTIKEMKTEPVFVEKDNIQEHSSSHNELPRVINANMEDSSCESDLEGNINPIFSRVGTIEKPSTISSQNLLKSKNSHNNVIQNYAGFKGSSIKSSTPLPRKYIPENYKLFLDQATQTDVELSRPSLGKIEEMEGILKNLYLRFESLVSQLNLNHDTDTQVSYRVSDAELNNYNNVYLSQFLNESSVKNQIKEKADCLVTKQEIDNSIVEPVNSSTAAFDNKEISNISRVRRMSAQTTNNIDGSPSVDADMVPIGNGNAIVPARLLKEIDWNSHTTATRQLLQAFFSRRVLATHSLTGKQSPAFKNKPPKKILDPKLVEDIVMTVSTQCGVPKNLVRNAITIKCTDEAKLYRNRQSYRSARLGNNQNEENIPQLTPSSDESSTVTN